MESVVLYLHCQLIMSCFVENAVLMGFWNNSWYGRTERHQQYWERKEPAQNQQWEQIEGTHTGLLIHFGFIYANEYICGFFESCKSVSTESKPGGLDVEVMTNIKQCKWMLVLLYPFIHCYCWNCTVALLSLKDHQKPPKLYAVKHTAEIDHWYSTFTGAP